MIDLQVWIKHEGSNFVCTRTGEMKGNDGDATPAVEAMLRGWLACAALSKLFIFAFGH